jgi:hypothetical protein
MKSKYPNLARMAIDVLSIPASSSDCERCFSALGDLLEPQRRKIGPELLAALHCIRSWAKRKVEAASLSSIAGVTDKLIDELYNIQDWQADDSKT